MTMQCRPGSHAETGRMEIPQMANFQIEGVLPGRDAPDNLGDTTRFVGPPSAGKISRREGRKEWLRNEIYFVAVLCFNFLYNAAPFFRLKKLFMKAAGFQIGKQTYIHIPVKFFSRRNLVVGDNVTVNPHCYLDNRSGIRIGNNVNIAHGTKIYTLGHDVNSPDLHLIGRPVVIEDDVFVFSNALVMPGVTIGKGAVVLPGSVVVKDVPQYSIVGGNPARVVKERKHLEFEKTNYSYWFAQ